MVDEAHVFRSEIFSHDLSKIYLIRVNEYLTSKKGAADVVRGQRHSILLKIQALSRKLGDVSICVLS